jgi:bifunctional UDP-N-acetylglucosamine pyrophosphorylase / glucosamine-1-phosphate N-acetyltransferase
MTHCLQGKAFFELAQFAHKDLFEESAFVWRALENLKSYLEQSCLGKISTFIPQGCILIHPELISIGEGTEIEPGTLIKGPCIIGKNCQIRFGAYLRGNVILGDRCIVGHSTEVKNALFFDEAKAPHFNYVGDSILGSRVNLGAGVKCANFRFDQKNIMISYGEKKIETELSKLGAILGDDVHVGCNVVLNPGTLLGKKTRCYPQVVVGGVFPENSLIKS